MYRCDAAIRKLDSHYRRRRMTAMQELKAVHPSVEERSSMWARSRNTGVIRGNCLYHASKKRAQHVKPRTAAFECGAFGARINEVALGSVMTPMLRAFIKKNQAANSTLLRVRLAATRNHAATKAN